MSNLLKNITLCVIFCLGYFANAGVVVNYYGHKLTLTWIPESKLICEPFTQNNLNEYLQQLNLKELVNELDEYSVQYKLDDFAYVQLVKKIAQVHSTNAINQKLLLYKFLHAKGYHVLLGYSNNNINVYGKTNVTLLNTIMVSLNAECFYDLTFSKKEKANKSEILFVNEFKNPRAIVLNEHTPPNLFAQTDKYGLALEYDGMLYFFNGNYNKSLAMYLNDLPDIEFSSVYINYGLSETASKTLKKQLNDAIAGMSFNRALDFILKFTQESFTYKSDVAYGSEKFAFPEEMLANPYADCEDKSFMFAYLAKEILGLGSIAMLYKNHINVAIGLNQNEKNYSFTLNNKKYIVCEPTGKGFKPGENYYDINSAKIIAW